MRVNLEKSVVSRSDDEAHSIVDILPLGTISQGTFPDSVFPQKFRDLVKDICQANQNLPEEYIKASVFAAVASAIGKSSRAAEGNEKPILWTLLVGKPGIGKSPAVKIALNPFHVIAERNKADFDSDMQAFTASDSDSKVKPFLKLPVHNKATIEAIADELEKNPKGTTIFSDEISSWVDNYSRNSKGSDLGFYLSYWDGSPASEATRHGKKSYCSDPCLSIIGGVQNGILESIMSKNNLSNGFFERWLFVLHDGKRKARKAQTPEWLEIKKRYQDVILGLYDADYSDIELDLSTDAKARFNAFLEQNNSDIIEYDENGQSTMACVLSKFEKYLIRFALIIENLRSFIDGTVAGIISLESLEAAIELFYYYTGNSEKILTSIETPAHLRGLTDWQRGLLRLLPAGTFETKTAVDLLMEIDRGLNRETARRRLARFLDNERLFTTVGHGKHEKRFS